jgi:hypothetical protein
MLIPRQWYNNLISTEISDKCEDVLALLCKTHGCKVHPCYSALKLTCLFFFEILLLKLRINMLLQLYYDEILHISLIIFQDGDLSKNKNKNKIVEVIVPELHELRKAHLVSIGSETLCSINLDCEDGYVSLLSWTAHL